MGELSRFKPSPAPFRERQRVRAHLFGAEQMLAARQVRPDSLQALNRALLLDELRRYRRRGKFPLNHDSRARPISLFIDSHGTRCAVAHLMEVTGFGELVKHVAATDNTARVRELARLAEVRAWLAAAGLSASEAARIQPTYESAPPRTEAEICFCGGAPLSNLALGTVIGSSDQAIEVRVERIGGDWPGLTVGDQLSVMNASGELGKGVLLTQDPGSGGSLSVLVRGYSRFGFNLTIFGDEAWCQLSRATADRPVSVDTVFEALLTTDSSCIDVFASVDEAWNRLENSSGEFSESSSEDGCGLAHGAAGPGSIEFTSAAILAALIAYRRRRRR